MSEPMSLLNPRNPDHRRILRRLEDELIIWLTTVRGDGQPQSVPVWFAWDGESFRMFSEPGKPKLDNIRKNPRVSLHLRATDTGGEVVVFEGLAELPDGPPASELPDYVQKYTRLMEEYGWTPEGFAKDYSEPVRVSPQRLRAS
jgi:PPOX class probable F420-dependent enzyme